MDGAAFEEDVRRLDPDRWLASRLVADPGRRSDLIVLLAFDGELTRALRIASRPITAQLRLAWWGEVLDEIEAGAPVRKHPLAQALAEVVARHALPFDDLHTLIAARWTSDDPGGAGGVEAAGPTAAQACAALSAWLLGVQAQAFLARAPGRVIGLASDLARGVLDQETGQAALVEAWPGAAADARRLPPAAFPAVAAATLARPLMRGRAAGEIERRLRLVAASATGRI